MEAFFSLLREHNIYISVNGEALSVKFPKDKTDPAILEQIRARKQEILHYFNRSATIPVAAQKESYVLSSAQHRMWVLSMMDDNGGAYNIPGVFELHGQLDKDVLQQCFVALTDRHEILRTVFRLDEDGDPKQFPCTVPPRIIYKALEEEALLPELSEVMTYRFDLENGPLIRLYLFQLAENKWVLAYVMHHIISDGWSLNVLFKELLQLYNATENELPPLRLQYKDYAEWQQTQLANGQMNLHRTYWQSRMEGHLPVLQLPTDRPRPAIKTYNGARLLHFIDLQGSERLGQYARANGGTMFMGLLTAVKILMATYSGQEDIILGTSVAGRDLPGLQDQIGLYVNALALRTQVPHSQSLHTHFMSVKQTVLEAFQHQVFPFDELVNMLHLKRDTSRNVLFDVMVVLQITNLEEQPLPAMKHMEVRRFSSHAMRHSSQFDLSFDFYDTQGGLGMSIEYNTDLFDTRTAGIIAGHLEELITLIPDHPEHTIKDLTYRLPAKPVRRGFVNSLKL